MNANNTNVTINIEILAKMLDTLTAYQRGNDASTPELKALYTAADFAINAAGVVFKQRVGGGQSHAGSQVGTFVVDGTKSSFL